MNTNDAVTVLLIASLTVLQSSFAEGKMVITPHTAQALDTCYPKRVSNPAALVPQSLLGPLPIGGIALSCQDFDGNPHYFIRLVAPNVHEVCRAFEFEAFPGKEQDQAIISFPYAWDQPGPRQRFTFVGWTRLPPADWQSIGYFREDMTLGFASSGACPQADNSRYIKLVHVTDGVLKQFTALWDRATSSEANFRQALRTNDDADRAVRQIFNNRQKPSIIECPDESDQAECVAYVGLSIAITFDLGPSGLKLTGIRWMSPA